MIRLKTLLFEQDMSQLPYQEIPGVKIIKHQDGSQTGELDDAVWFYRNGESDYIRKSNWYEAPGIDTSGLGWKINKFAKRFTNAFGEQFKDEQGNPLYQLPVITSGFRPPKRQIDAVWDNWKANNQYLYNVNYKEPFKTYISDLFARTNLEETDPQYLTPDQAKSDAVEYLETREKQKSYMSKHQTRGAIDIALFAGGSYGEKNNWLNDWLASEKKEGHIKSYIDERGKNHFHIRLRGNE